MYEYLMLNPEIIREILMFSSILMMKTIVLFCKCACHYDCVQGIYLLLLSVNCALHILGAQKWNGNGIIVKQLPAMIVSWFVEKKYNFFLFDENLLTVSFIAYPCHVERYHIILDDNGTIKREALVQYTTSRRFFSANSELKIFLVDVLV